MSNRSAIKTLALLTAAMGSLPMVAYAVTIDFEELPLAAGVDHYNGSDGAGGFESRGVWFDNNFTDFGGGCCWEQFAYSRATNTTQQGPANQYSAFAGSGAGGSSMYGVVFSGIDAGDSGLAATLQLPEGSEPQSIAVTNTTWAALVMRDGDPNGFAKKFGGASSDDPDFFSLRILGLDGDNQQRGEIEFYLADYRLADNELDYVVESWQDIDLTPLSGLGVTRLAFRLDSSDFNPTFGLNTPAYVAIDNLTLTTQSVAGDYNGDGQVNLADFTRWRDALGREAVPAGSGADGDSSGTVDINDYALWRTAATGEAATRLGLHTVPEPNGLTICLPLLVAMARLSRNS